MPTFFGGPARVLAAKAHGLDLLVLDAAHLYDRPGGALYRYRRGRLARQPRTLFAALSWVAAEIAGGALSEMAARHPARP